uniref:BHLH domain-containing protein n=1 Tax=Ananas comosus var. bracteatus TaxID=296719 RepID=A0A6V7NGV3_ANACO|nr:unnamed protein product [Ananas comosus var. bracteatus]
MMKQQTIQEERSCGRGSRVGSSRTRVKLSTDPQSVAARARRHRISDRFRTLRSLVPGGTKLDTVSMLDEAIHYVKFLEAQLWLLRQVELSLPADFAAAHMSGDFDNNHEFEMTQQLFCDSVQLQPPPPSLSPSLPPLPTCFIQGEEEMILDLMYS